MYVLFLAAKHTIEKEKIEARLFLTILSNKETDKIQYKKNDSAMRHKFIHRPLYMKMHLLILRELEGFVGVKFP